MKRTEIARTAPFCLAAFWVDFAIGIHMVAIPYLAMDLGAGSLELGSLGSVRAVSYALFCILAGILAEKRNRMKIIAISCISSVIVSSVTGFATLLSHLYLLGILWGFAGSFFWPPVFAWLGDSHDAKRLGGITGAVNISWSMGIITGCFAGGSLYMINPRLPFVVAILPAVIAYAVMVFAPRKSEVPPGEKTASVSSPGVSAKLIVVWLGNFSACCLGGVMGIVFPKLGLEIGIGAQEFGALAAISGLGRTAVFALGLWRSDWLRDWRVSIPFQIVAAGMVATVCVAESFLWLGAVFAVLGVCFGTTYYASLYGSIEGESSRGLKSGIHEAILVGGMLLGSLGGGSIAHYRHVRAPYVPIAGLVVLLAVAQVVLVRLSGRSGRPSTENG